MSAQPIRLSKTQRACAGPKQRCPIHFGFSLSLYDTPSTPCFGFQIDISGFDQKYGEEALDFVRNEPVDLVLVDVPMPLMNGCEATKKIRRIRPTLPTIGQSAQVLPENIAMGLACGMNEYLEKPIKAAQLLNMIEKYLNVTNAS